MGRKKREQVDPELRNRTPSGKIRRHRVDREAQEMRLFNLIQDTANLTLVPAPQREKTEEPKKKEPRLWWNLDPSEQNEEMVEKSLEKQKSTNSISGEKEKEG
jgi:hypothetical protein